MLHDIYEVTDFGDGAQVYRKGLGHFRRGILDEICVDAIVLNGNRLDTFRV